MNPLLIILTVIIVCKVVLYNAVEKRCPLCQKIRDKKYAKRLSDLKCRFCVRAALFG
jgi:hypothetical protein